MDLFQDIEKIKSLTEEQIFLQFQYPEIRDLLKAFLTLISAILAFTVTFSEKIINVSSSSPKRKTSLHVSFTLLMSALVCCGLGIYTNYTAAEQAIIKLSGNNGNEFDMFKASSFLLQDLSGLLFVAGMAVIASIVFVKE